VKKKDEVKENVGEVEKRKVQQEILDKNKRIVFFVGFLEWKSGVLWV